MKLTPQQLEALRIVAAGRFYPSLEFEEDGWYARWQALDGSNAWVDAYVREAAVTPLSEDAEDQRHETLHDAWMMALKSRTGLVRWDDAECRAFAAELESWSGNAADDVEARRAVAFRFETGDGPDAPFAVSCAVPKGRRAMRALGLSVYVWGPLRGLAAAGAPAGMLRVALLRSEAEEFLRSGARDLTEAGYTVEGVAPAATVTAAVAQTDDGDGKRDPELKLTVHVAGEPVTADEIRFLLDQGSSLVYFRDRWIEVDRGILKEALRALERGLGRKPNLLSFAFGIGRVGSLEFAELQARGWLRGLVNALKAKGEGVASEPLALDGATFRTTLRDYQRRGVEWLRFLTDHGFGALLADDMGLGKTVQVLAFLVDLKARLKERPHTLIVAPLTLLANWRHELERFAPQLALYVHAGETRHAPLGFRRTMAGCDVALTSYSLLVRDYEAFATLDWETIVLDEAQAVKNPDTQAAKAIRALTPRRRIALTGTPIENSVADVWALEDFLNPGFLGDRQTFRERFVKPIALGTDAAAAKRLRHALEPFVLRRLKSDPSVDAQLGTKREVREYCTLTPSERRRYEEALAAFRGTVHTSGDVFALLTELKILCDGEGKLQRLGDLLQEIFDSGESVLVFTQYVKVGARILQALQLRFGRRFPFLHGGLSPAQREQEIARFNRGGPGAFVLSLKTGGFGLNLVKATHVVHFDRWWNPAVENQATDRVHRIGQEKSVTIHLMLVEGTLEEHIDALLERKSRVAGAVITEAEWLEAAKLDE